MTIEEAWEQLHKPYNRFDKDLIALRIIAEDQEKRLRDLELKSIISVVPQSNISVRKRGRPRKETVHAESDGTGAETPSS